MKKIIFISAAMASCLIATAQTPDTLRIRNVSEVTVITSMDSQTISMKGSDNDSTFRYESSVRITPDSNVSVREGRLDLFNWDILKDRREQRRMLDSSFVVKPTGLPDNPDGNAPAKLKKFKSYRRVSASNFSVIGLGVAQPYDGPDGMSLGGTVCSDIFFSIESVSFNFAWNHLHIYSGLNVGYRSFRLMEDGILSVQDGKIAKGAVPQGLELKRSALRYNYLSVPALFGISLGSRGHFEVYGGAEICYNFNGRIKNKYSQKEVQVPVKYTDIRLETFTWNYIAGINFFDFGVYAKYSPCSVLQAGTGPSFDTYSFGILLDF
ncbi:MAG: hypothetical protein IJK76_06745 [Bacteroidales bacterium]|nr:hypothetical protein [Bacteroidales bacterium]